MKILQDRIRRLRKEKDWSQNDLAKNIDSDSNQISRYERGTVHPSLETIGKLARAFEVTADYLLMEDASRVPLRKDDSKLLKHIEKIQCLNGKAKDSLYTVIDALYLKNKIEKTLTHEVD